MNPTPAEQLDLAIELVKWHSYRSGQLDSLSRFQVIAAQTPESFTKSQLIQQLKDAIKSVKNQNQQ